MGAYLAVPTVLLYPVGLFAMFLQFTTYFELEFYTAWYAASLADRMMVIGLGATILVVALLGSVLLSWKVSRILCMHEDSRRNEDRPDSVYPARSPVLAAKVALWSLIALVLYVLYSRILAAGRVSCLAIFGRQFNESEAEARRHQLNLLPDSLLPAMVFVFGGVWGGYLIFGAYQRWRKQEYSKEGQYPPADYRLLPFLDKGVTQGWILRGLVAAYGCSILASLVLAWATPAFMPFMHYNAGIEATERGDVSDDRYLSHFAGRWYVLHRYNTDGARWYSVLALSEDQAKYAGVVPLSAMNPRVAPFPLPGIKDADQRWCGAPPPPPARD